MRHNDTARYIVKKFLLWISRFSENTFLSMMGKTRSLNEVKMYSSTTVSENPLGTVQLPKYCNCQLMGYLRSLGLIHTSWNEIWISLIEITSGAPADLSNKWSAMPQCLLMKLMNFIMQTYSFLTPELFFLFTNKNQDLVKKFHLCMWHNAKYSDLCHTLG